MGVGGPAKQSFPERELCVPRGGAYKPSAQQISENVSLSPVFGFSQGEREGREENSMVSSLN